MEFEEYLKAKKIDPVRFKDLEPKEFLQWQAEFDQMHPNSFTERKKFYLNPYRRKYHLTESKH